ncbi:hypothetical protein FIBSPDRAFT_728140 [Athelia psychrophila]|uniref:PIN domain-containing protein n=1 Tax=Athelia psychrophila TaxID=1759441 RepID=A0A166S069_9AGAM|nr:hypothetical protein FIBSPDRAFT_728140 [Fibularhizoctonia sp. CBS 109695]
MTPAVYSRQDPRSREALPVVPGYSVPVVDTNILPSSLSMLASVVESLRWAVIVPLPVIMELDGISANTSQLGETAKAAMSYLTSHVRSHSTSLKVQTSKGNYLTFTFRTEQVDFKDEASWERNMDGLILRTAIWQDDHWSDRSSMLKNTGAQCGTAVGAVKVVLLSLDHNLRLKARSRQLPAASETDLPLSSRQGPKLASCCHLLITAPISVSLGMQLPRGRYQALLLPKNLGVFNKLCCRELYFAIARRAAYTDADHIHSDYYLFSFELHCARSCVSSYYN